MGSATIMQFLGKFVHQLRVANDSDDRDSRRHQVECSIVETGTPTQPDPAPIDGQRRHEHHLARSDSRGRQQRSRRFGQAVGSSLQILAPCVLCPLQRPWFPGHRDQYNRGSKAKRVEHVERPRFASHRDICGNSGRATHRFGGGMTEFQRLVFTCERTRGPTRR